MHHFDRWLSRLDRRIVSTPAIPDSTMGEADQSAGPPLRLAAAGYGPVLAGYSAMPPPPLGPEGGGVARGVGRRLAVARGASVRHGGCNAKCELIAWRQRARGGPARRRANDRRAPREDRRRAPRRQSLDPCFPAVLPRRSVEDRRQSSPRQPSVVALGWPAANPSSPSMLSAFFSVLYRTSPSGPFLSAHRTSWSRCAMKS